MNVKIEKINIKKEYIKGVELNNYYLIFNN